MSKMNILYNFLFISLLFLCLDEANFAPNKQGTRIIGGNVAFAGQFPFVAAIYVQTSNSRFFCGGAIISNEWVVTSGHCVNNAISFTIQIGSNLLTGDDSQRVIVASSEHLVHPEFNPETFENDIGLIKLRMPVTYTAYLQPINLPPVSLLNETTVTALGWGQTSDFDSELSNELRYVNVTILPNVECKLYYGEQVNDNMACVEGNYNEGTCNGDTGGPLVEYVHRSYWIVGVSSFISTNGCESTNPSGYTRTYPYTDWILSVINS